LLLFFKKEESFLLSLLLASIIGSFLGTIIGRTVSDESFVTGRSRCDSCGRTLRPGELIPIVSYLVLRGRCRACHAPIGRFHLLVELAAVAVAASAIVAGAEGRTLAAGCVLGWTLLALAWIDALTMRLPDFLSLPLILAGLGDAVLEDPDGLTGRALGAAVGYTMFRLLAWAYRRFRHRDGLGEGDAKLLAAAGAWLGLAPLGTIVLIAALSALLYAGWLAVSGRRLDASTRLPFGPFLALGLWADWLAWQ
jgi:leader peptidase (prepilin peptidase)/N-methyltransferase